MGRGREGSSVGLGFTHCRHYRFGKEPTEVSQTKQQGSTTPTKLTERLENNSIVVIIYYFLKATSGKVNTLIVYPSVHI